MDPITNPFAPGAGTPPPELAGRDELRETVRVATERVRLGRPTKSVLMVGLRGVGKTVLLDRMRDDAEAIGLQTMRIEAPESRSLPAMLAPELRGTLLKLSRNAQAKDLAVRALKGLAGFAKALKLTYSDIEVGLDYEPEPGLADNGDLEHDLQALLETVGDAAKKAGTALVMFVDELQYVEETQLAALITALHRTAQRGLPGRSGRCWTTPTSRPHGQGQVVCGTTIRLPRDWSLAAACGKDRDHQAAQPVRSRDQGRCVGRNYGSNSRLSVLPSGMGKASVGYGHYVANYTRRR